MVIPFPKKAISSQKVLLSSVTVFRHPSTKAGGGGSRQARLLLRNVASLLKRAVKVSDTNLLLDGSDVRGTNLLLDGDKHFRGQYRMTNDIHKSIWRLMM